MEKRALVVDDSLFIRIHIAGILEKSGFKVCGEASNAIEAVQKYKELKPDLVTMDIVMPKIEELDGIGAIREIIGFDPKAKVIVVSAMGEEPLLQEAIKLGAKGFLAKPFQAEAFLKVINDIFSEEQD